MKTSAALFAVIFSAQVAADCSDIEFEPIRSSSLDTTGGEVQEIRTDISAHGDRRRAFLNCLKPAPFTLEPIDIELDDIADDFSRGSALLLKRTGAAVAAS